MGDDRLVRRHDRLACPERRVDQRARRLDAAHELDDDVDLRVGDEVRGRIGQQPRRDALSADLAEVAHRDRREADLPAVGAGEALRVLRQSLQDGPAHGPCPEDRDAQGRAAHRRRA
jgi:hypothetical protein